MNLFGKDIHVSKKAAAGVMSTLLACVMVIGSIAEPVSAASKKKAETPKQATTVTIGQKEKDICKTMPVICIQTKSLAEDALRFVDEPVTGFVAEQIASWTPDYEMPPEPYYEDCLITVLNTKAKKVIKNAEAKVKVRGNWTTDYPKKSLRLKFDKKTNILGLNDGQEYKNWVLLAEYKDGSMLRDKTAFQIANEILGADGLYCSDCMLVAVMINGGYRGIYLLAEYTQLNEGRVEGEEPAKDYMGTDISYLLELDDYCLFEDELNQFHIDYNKNAPLKPYDGKGGSGRTIRYLPVDENDPKIGAGFTIKSDINCAEQRDFIAKFVGNTYKIMYEAAYNKTAYVFNNTYTSIKKNKKITPREAIEKVVDVNSLADMYLISELTCDADLYFSSFFMSVDFSKDGSKKLTFQAPWDFDSSMGIKNRCIDGTGYYAGNIMPDVNGGTDYGWNFDTINPWLAVLAYQDWFMDIVKEKWQKAYESGVFQAAADMIKKDAKTYKAEFKRNYERWNNLIDNEAFYGELSDRQRACRTQQDAANWLLEWFNSRVEFLNGEWGKK